MKRILLATLNFLATIYFVGLFAQTKPDMSSLTHAWDFNDGTASDQIGSADGVLRNDATITDGNLELLGSDGIAGYVSIPGNIVQINSYTELTVETWCTPQAEGNLGGHNMLNYFGATVNDLGVDYLFFTPSKLNPSVGRAAISCLNDTTPWSTEDGIDMVGVNEETLLHCVFTVSGSEMQLYINAVSDSGSIAFTNANNSLANLSNDSVLIGRGGYAGDNTWKGTVHKVSIYNKALSGDEIQWLYDQGEEYAYDPATSVNEHQNIFDPNVYVSDGFLHIRNLKGDQIKSLKIYNLQGKVVYQASNISEEVINHNLITGSVYLVRVESDQGSFLKKVVVE